MLSIGVIRAVLLVAESMTSQITNNLKHQRQTNETSEPFGILTHHLNMIESDWEEFRNIFTILKNSNSVRCVDPLELFTLRKENVYLQILT